ncbi:GNAT family N-acetyltransferase [Falsibacillus pallidus]|uniref:Putative acetyltransferase n=1 Tax=Falsibacillus pallidus TaxID=493781 RepID=A0A370GQ10_9BACI|nr:GNAT family N-acetyltransferase [Falsibacillus pallidus]RDI45818.1 putative acetyltransferase [Falsibacillus pallidus]
MTDIRLLKEEEMGAFVEIAVNAYPGMMSGGLEAKQKLMESLQKAQAEDPSIDLMGVWKNGTLVGGMRLHQYEMNFHGNMIQTGGVGFVSVDLLHKKEKIAKEIIQYFIRHFKEKGVPLLSLYPFRPDFYKKMGFGMGTKMDQYAVVPRAFPNFKDKSGLVFLDASDKEDVKKCYELKVMSTHGMMHKTEAELDRMFQNPEIKIIGYKNNGKLEGYLQFHFKKASEMNFIKNHLIIKEWIYETQEAFKQFSSFLHSQDDQFERIIINTQDESFHMIFDDPRNGTDHLIPSVYHETNKSGAGIMYRAVDPPQLINAIGIMPNPAADFVCKLFINDSFDLDGEKEWILSNQNHILSLKKNEGEGHDFAIQIDIADFSSMIMGAVSPAKLYQYGKLSISGPDNIRHIKTVFSHMDRPVSMTAF